MRPSETKMCRVNETCSIADDDDGDGDDDNDDDGDGDDTGDDERV